MRNESSRHHGPSYPIEYNRRMLLSKAELPQDVLRGPIDRVIEWAPSAEQIKEMPALDEEKERPMFLIVSAYR